MTVLVSGGTARARRGPGAMAWMTLAGLATLVGTARPDARQTPAQTQAISGDPFIIKPYWQLGDVPKLAPSETVRALWQSANDTTATWAVDVRQRDGTPWRPAIVTGGRLVSTAETPYRVFNVPLTRLEPGGEFEYRVSRNGQVVFAAKGKARASAGQPYRFVVTGDTGADTNQERRIVHQIHRAEPDFFGIAGDIVYSTGRMAEDPEEGLSDLQLGRVEPGDGRTARPFAAVVWGLRQSRRGHGRFRSRSGRPGLFPDLVVSAQRPLWPGRPAELLQVIKGPPERLKAHLALIPGTFPRMANYSFTMNSHWTFIDSNVYVDWSDAYLRNWLARDLAAARHAAWKFVVFHHAPFNSSRAHFSEQHMRLVSDVLEHRGVDIVFNGHVHNYQRTRPLKFLAKPAPMAPSSQEGSYMVDGDFEDRHGVQWGDGYDARWCVHRHRRGRCGRLRSRPDRQRADVAAVHDEARPATLYGFTVVDVDGLQSTLRQISETGEAGAIASS